MQVPGASYVMLPRGSLSKGGPGDGGPCPTVRTGADLAQVGERENPGRMAIGEGEFHRVVADRTGRARRHPWPVKRQARPDRRAAFAFLLTYSAGAALPQV